MNALPKPPSVLTTKDGVDGIQQQIELDQRNPARAFLKKPPVKGNDLSRVRDRVLRQTRHRSGQQHVSRRVRPPKVASQRDTDRRGQSAPVQCIALDDNDRSANPRPRANRRRQLGPADVALGDHHTVSVSTRLPAAARKASSFPPISPHTRFIASVTSSGVCRARYSSSAAAYTSLRDRRSCMASRSARSKMSSGMDTAVFIPAV